MKTAAKNTALNVDESSLNDRLVLRPSAAET
jgi:hypothetical protein